MTLKSGLIIIWISVFLAAVSSTTLEEATTDDYSFFQTPGNDSARVASLIVQQRTGFTFGVRTCNDARIVLLTLHSDGSGEQTEINLGTTATNIITVTDLDTGTELYRVDAGVRLTECLFIRFFWVSWRDGRLTLGRGNNVGANPTLVFKPTSGRNLQDVATVQFVAGSGIAAWYLPQDQGENLVMQTPNDQFFNRLWKRVQNKGEFFIFSLQGTKNARLFMSPLRDVRVHEIVFGEIDSGTGQPTGIRLFVNGTQVESNRTTEALLTPTLPQEFWLSWSRGVLQLGRGPAKGRNIILTYNDPKVGETEFLGFGSGPDATATWVFFETFENYYIFAENKGDVDLWDGVIVSPRTGFTTFVVQACEQVRVGLSQDTIIDGELSYLIDIDYPTPDGRQIRFSRGVALLDSIGVPETLLRCDVPVPFWMSWSDDTFRIGLGIYPGLLELFSYVSPTSDAFTTYQCIGFLNTHQAGAVFAVLDNSGDQAIINTHDNAGDMNTWVTVKNEFYRAFTLQACSDAMLTLTEAAGDIPEYSFIFGADGDRNKLRATKVGVGFRDFDLDDGTLLDCDVAKEFWIAWMEGIIRIGRGHHFNEDTIFVILDGAPYPVNTINLATSNDVYATWTFEMDTGDEIVSNTSPTLIKLEPGRRSFYLRVKGSQARVTLSEVYGYNDNAYSFVFGDGDGTMFSIQDQDGKTVASGSMGDPLHPVFLKDYWITWNNGILNAGLGRLPAAGRFFLNNGYNTGDSYSPASVQLAGSAEYVALAELGPESLFTTTHLPNFNVSYDHFWYHLRRRSNLLFGIQACASASMILSPVPNDISAPTTYRLQIGGANNDMVQLSAGSRVATAEAIGLLSCDEERIFWINWNNNKLSFGRGNEIGKNVVLSVGRDALPVTIPVNAITFSTGGGNTGTWRVSNNQEPLGSHPKDANKGLSSGAIAGIVIGVLIALALVGAGVFVALKGVPESAKNMFSNSKDAVDSSVQFQHTNLEGMDTNTGDD